MLKNNQLYRIIALTMPGEVQLKVESKHSSTNIARSTSELQVLTEFLSKGIIKTYCTTETDEIKELESQVTQEDKEKRRKRK